MSSDPTAAPPPADPVARFVAGNRALLAVALLLATVAWLYPAVKYGRKAFASAPAAEKKDADLSKPEEAAKLDAVDPNRGDHIALALTSGVGAVVTLALALWVLFAAPPFDEAAKLAQARLAVLVSGGAVGLLLMLLGMVMFYLWFESLSKWLNSGDTKEARWVLIPVFVFLVGAGLTFAAAQPARAEERSNPTLRRFIYGSNFALTALLLAFALLVGNVFLALRLPNRLDTTESGFYTLSDETNKYLATLDQPVKAYTTLPEDAGGRFGRIAGDARRLLAAAQEVNPAKFQVRLLNPVLNKDEIAALKAKYPQFDLNDEGILLTAGEDESRSSYIRFDELYTEEAGGEFRGDRTLVFQGESKVMREVLFLTENKTKPVVYFTQGNGELEVTPAAGPQRGAAPRPATRLRSLLEKNYVDVRPWQPDLKDPKVPDDATAVVVADPISPLPPEAVAALRAYMLPAKPDAKKGKLIVLSSPHPTADGKGVANTGLEELLRTFKVDLGRGYLVGRPLEGLGYTEMLVFPNPELTNANNPIALAYQPPKTLVLSDCRTVDPIDEPPGGPAGAGPYKADWLFVTYPPNRITWLDKDPPVNPAQTMREIAEGKNIDLIRKLEVTNRGGRVAGCVVTEGTTPRAVVIGSGAAFADPTGRRQRGSEPPVELVPTALDWLRDRPSLSVVNKPYRGYTPNKAADSTRLFWLPFGLTLLGITALGAGVWVVRRK